MDMLGDTLSQIAFEKGGIIKPGRPVVLYPQEYEASAVLRQIALERNSPLTEVSLSQVVLKKEAFAELVFDYHFKDMALEGITISLSGIHQVYNAATALTAIMMLIEMGVDISRDSIYNGLKNVRWPGRIEKVCDNPIIILDGAHNEAGALALSDAVTRYFKDKRINLLMGMLGDKDVKKVAEILCPLADSLILTRPDNPRAMEAEELYNIVEGYGIETHIEPDAEKAVEYGVKITDENSVLLISGSLYLIGQVRSILK